MSRLKKRRTQYRTAWIAGGIFLVFLAGSLLFVSSIRQQNEAQISAYLEEANGQRKAAVLQQIEGDFQVLRGVAVGLGEMDLQDSGSVFSVLDTINRSNTFEHMGLAGLDGLVDLVDLSGEVVYGMDLSGLRAFRQAVRGMDAVSPVFYEERTGQFVTYYAVPVMQQGRVAAVLCAANTEEILMKALSVPVFQGVGYFCLVDKGGIMISPTADPNPAAFIGASIFDIATISEAEQARMNRALAFEETSHFVFDINGVEQLCVLMPVSINNWFIASVVPHHAINTYYNKTAVGTSVIIAAACLVFLLLLAWQLHAMENSQRELEKLAYRDSLTGLRNYTKLVLDAEKLLADSGNRRVAVWSMDIKQFKSVNDIAGIKAGDHLLRCLAGLLQQGELPEAFSCRIAADQFAGILPCDTLQGLTAYFEELFERLALEEVVPNHQIKVEFAIGIYCAHDFEEQISFEEMVNRAAIAKKEAKALAGTEVIFFTQAMGNALHWNAELEAGSARALEEGQFQFYLQPKIRIQNGLQVVGAEALARWLHPTHGSISPEEFVPLFERNGFVVELDRYIFEQVCIWLAARLENGAPPICIAINVSRQGLFREDFINYYTAVKQSYRIPDRMLELEFTESVAMDDYKFFHQTVLDLQQAGFICSIDDFGSGYSSLNVLKSLPIDVLKLDAMFFRDSYDRARTQLVIASFLHMASLLSISTVAEGVENIDQVEFLQVAGCDVVQGYFFSPPLPPEEFIAFWKANKDGMTLEGY